MNRLVRQNNEALFSPKKGMRYQAVKRYERNLNAYY